ncbi:hypothetical protein ES288_A04G156300v1 [Gossypium darwinii]|uniref:Plastocyanin-like domain-containing protein n=1 Tax=Gossypium darwinii TaxID=34276 RepID=A0A5D2GX53_GOSDA|nr:hypothetical protein ES288_A04G156300v1 [Gossypium darwinii]
MKSTRFSLTFCFIGLALFPLMYVQSAPTTYKLANASVTVASNASSIPVGGPNTVVSNAPPPVGADGPNTFKILMNISHQALKIIWQ